MILPRQVSSWPPIFIELYLERFAIMVVEGKVPEDEARRDAEADIRNVAKAEGSPR